MAESLATKVGFISNFRSLVDFGAHVVGFLQRKVMVVLIFSPRVEFFADVAGFAAT